MRLQEWRDQRRGDATTHIPRSIGRDSHVGGEGRVSFDAGQRYHPWYNRGAWDAVRGVAENRSGNCASNTCRICRRSGSLHRTRRQCNVGQAAVVMRMSKAAACRYAHVEGRRRLVDTLTAPPEQRFAGDGVGLEAIVIWSKGSNPALASNLRLNVIHPCLRSRTSDSQYSRSSGRKSNMYPSRVSLSCHCRKGSRSSTDILLGM